MCSSDLLMLGWFLYDLNVHHRIHTDLLVIPVAMAVTKLASMAWLHLTR